jgi:hypothetical protein
MRKKWGDEYDMMDKCKGLESNTEGQKEIHI